MSLSWTWLFPYLGCVGGRSRSIVVELQDVLRKNLSVTLQEPLSRARSRTPRNRGTEELGSASRFTWENRETGRAESRSVCRLNRGVNFKEVNKENRGALFHEIHTSIDNLAFTFGNVVSDFLMGDVDSGSSVGPPQAGRSRVSLRLHRRSETITAS
ncbi:hypothetical protein AOLI_G00211860 [Acnodon oligacanthus]